MRLPANMTCTQCILQYTFTGGDLVGVGPQSAEVITRDCLEDDIPKLGCGNQETFRGCSDICIGDFCPQDQETCLKADALQHYTFKVINPKPNQEQFPEFQKRFCHSSSPKQEFMK